MSQYTPSKDFQTQAGVCRTNGENPLAISLAQVLNKHGIFFLSPQNLTDESDF